MKISVIFTFIIIITCVSACHNASKNQEFLPVSEQSVIIADWENLRFGAFVHFNDNTFLESEFSQNTDPEKFNPQSDPKCVPKFISSSLR